MRFMRSRTVLVTVSVVAVLALVGSIALAMLAA